MTNNNYFRKWRTMYFISLIFIGLHASVTIYAANNKTNKTEEIIANNDFCVTFSLSMMNTLYFGIDNPLNISVAGIKPENIEISVTNATQTRSTTGWNIRPTKPGTEVEITVSSLIDGKNVVLERKLFRVQRIPFPLLSIEYTDEQGNKKLFKGGVISKDLLNRATNVVATCDGDLNVEFEFPVLSFALTYYDSEGNERVESVKGSGLTQRELNIINVLANGKTVYIINAMVKGPDGIIRRLPPFDIKTK